MVHVGHYSFWSKVVAYRNDYCLSCAAPRRAVRIRSFEVIHVFFVPLIPVGFLRSWKCSVCGRDPHVHTSMSKFWLWILVALLATVATAAWMASPLQIEDPNDMLGLWAGRIGLPIGLFFLIRYTLRRKPDVRLKEKLKDIQPAHEVTCPFCQGALMPGSKLWRCSNCGVERT